MIGAYIKAEVDRKTIIRIQTTKQDTHSTRVLAIARLAPYLPEVWEVAEYVGAKQ
jgi:hypothetical protein